MRVSWRLRGETVRVEWEGVRSSQERVRVRVQCGHTMFACDFALRTKFHWTSDFLQPSSFFADFFSQIPDFL